MNLGTGALVFLGFMLLLLGVVSRLMNLPLLTPYIQSFLGYFIAANTCFLMALIVDKFEKQ